MSSSSSPQLSEENLRALSRKDLQALAKKENIKPANAASATLIKRLLAKFGLTTNQEPSGTKAKTKRSTPSDGPSQNRRSTRLATTEISESVPNGKPPASAPLFSPAPDRAPAAESSIHQSPTTVDPPVANPGSPAIPSRAASPASTEASTSDLIPLHLRTNPAPPPAPPKPSPVDEPPNEPPAAPDPVYIGQAVHPSHPNHPFPCPTRKTLHTYQEKLLDLNHALLDIPSFFPTMERMLPNLERTAATVKTAMKAVVWNGYYLEREVVEKMKHRQQLWDGTNAMPPGPARDRWFAFLEEVAREYDRLEEEARDKEALAMYEAASSSTTSLSSKSLKRQREAEEEVELSKRPRSERSLLFSA